MVYGRVLGQFGVRDIGNPGVLGSGFEWVCGLRCLCVCVRLRRTWMFMTSTRCVRMVGRASYQKVVNMGALVIARC